MADKKENREATQLESNQPQQNTQGKQQPQSVRTTGQEGSGQRSLSRREPFSPSQWQRSPSAFMNRFADEMERMFEDFGFGRGWLSPSGRRGLWPSGLGEMHRSMWSPEIEVFEREGQLVVRADLPGLNKDDVKVDITDDGLTIQGERRQEHEENEENFYRSERSYGSFYRSIPLPEGVNDEDIQASFRDGVLEITMPAPERARRGRRIEIGEGAKGQEQPRADAQTTSK